MHPAISLFGGTVTCPPVVDAGPMGTHVPPTTVAGGGGTPGAKARGASLA